MKKIKVNKIVTQTVEAFDPEGNSLGMVTYEEFNDLRIQIMDNEAEGYYVMFEDEKYMIEPTGGFHKWPRGLFNLITDQLNYLFGI